MTLPERDLGYLQDIGKFARRTMSHLQDVSYETFTRDDEKQDAVIRCLMVIGEAAGRLSDAARASLPQFDWHAMKAMRHVLVHDYGRIDVERVWNVATTHVLQLEREVREFLGSIP